MKPEYAKILDECAEIAEERQKSYGDIEKNLQEITTILYADFGIKLNPSEIVKVFIATKIARQKHKHKDDNLKDVINYFAILASLSNYNLTQQQNAQRN